jgi:hypothetical protein
LIFTARLTAKKFPDVIDVKTGGHHPTHGLQTAAQAELLSDNGYERPRRRFSLHLHAHGNYTLNKHESHSDFGVFNSLLNIHRYKKLNNL